MKTICIDGFNIALPQGSGIATYGRNLLSAVRSLGGGTQVLYGPPNRIGSDNLLNEVVLADSLNVPPKMRKSERYRRTLLSRFGQTATPVTPSDEVIWPSRSGGRPDADSFWAAQNLFQISNRAHNVYGSITPVTFASGHGAKVPDAMHWTATLPLQAKGTANIYTIHDLIPLRLPHTTGEDKAKYRQLCQEIAKRADHIAVVSETTRQDVIRILGVDERRVTNTYQAVKLPEALTSRSQDDVIMELEGVFNLGWKDYFLYYGAIEPKKNLGRIVEAYLSSGEKKPLVIIGGRSWLDAPETALLNQVKKDGGPSSALIRQYEYMPLSMLVSLIRGARATLFPSLYEGFGLPVLESMMLKTAVLTSTAGSLPEVAGDAALSVDPYDVQALTRGIRALSQDDALVDAFVEKGIRRAQIFSEEAYTQRLGALYSAVGVM